MHRRIVITPSEQRTEFWLRMVVDVSVAKEGFVHIFEEMSDHGMKDTSGSIHSDARFLHSIEVNAFEVDVSTSMVLGRKADDSSAQSINAKSTWWPSSRCENCSHILSPDLTRYHLFF